jgi:hypothetical protein
MVGTGSGAGVAAIVTCDAAGAFLACVNLNGHASGREWHSLPRSSAAALSPSRRLRLAGLLVIVVGWIAAALVIVTSAPEDALDAPGLARSEARTLERVGGKAVARTVALDDWLASLWHGERLGWTLAVLSLVAGAACLYVAALMDETAPGDARRD